MAALVSETHRAVAPQALLEETQKYLQRFETLQGLLATRRLQLQASVELHQFRHLSNAELTWVAEHMPSASPASHTNCLADVQSLGYKHKGLQAEVKAHQGQVQWVLHSGQSLVASGHPQAQHIVEQCQKLEGRWAELERACEARAQCLQQARAVQQYLLDASELEGWVQEKGPQASSQDYGRDEATTRRLLKEHQGLQQELALRWSSVEELEQRAQTLAGPEAPQQLSAVWARLREQLRALQELATTRDQELKGTLKLHEFTRESEDLQSWLATQKQMAAGGESPGEDYEHVLHLCTQFAQFQHQVELSGQRVATCQQLAKSLEHRHSCAPQVRQHQQDVQAAWSELWELTQARCSLLRNAETTLKVHRDLLEALTQVQEKATSLPSGVAQDLRGTEAQLRRHKEVELELTAMEQQLQELLETGSRVQKLYPGPQARAVQQRQQAVMQVWEALRLRVEQRRAQLERACLLAHFHATVRDYGCWAARVQQELQVEESALAPSSAPLEFSAHQRLRVELEAQEELRQQAAQLGQQALLASGTPTEEGFLKTSALGNSVEEVEQLICKHEVFQKVLTAQDEKEAALHQQLKMLQGPRVQDSLRTTLERRARVKELAKRRGHALHTALLTASFTRAASQAEDWMQERAQRLKEPIPPGDLRAQSKLLWKHQAFEAEVQAHEEVITSVAKMGEALLVQSHPQAGEVSQRLQALQKHWENLRQAVALRGQELEDKCNFLAFLQRVDLAEAWLQEQEAMVNTTDLGQDLEHCLQLCRRLRGFSGASAGDTLGDAYIRSISDLSLQLKNRDPKEVQTICQRRGQLDSRWTSFRSNLLRYQQQLQGALEMHTLSQELDDAIERITEKGALLQAPACSQDLESAQRLLRRHQELEQAMGLIQAQVETLEREVGRLCQRNPGAAPSLSRKQRVMMDSWWQLRSRAQKWRESLEALLEAQKLQAMLQEVLAWAQGLRAEMAARSSPCGPEEAQRQLEEHQGLRVELDSRMDSISWVQSTGQRLLAAGHPSTPDLRQALAALEQELSSLEGAWQEQQLQLQQALELQLILSSVGKMEGWLGSKEASLSTECPGDPLASAETLLWKHEMLEQSLEVQAEQISTLEATASSLRQGGCPEAQSALARCQAMLLRKEALLKQAGTRRRQLEELRQLQAFLRESSEVAAWLREKNLVALEEGWRNPATLQSQLRKHRHLQAELDMSLQQQQELQTEGQRLLQGSYPARETIQAWLWELGQLWDELQANCQRKEARLQEACEALRLQRSVEELENWLEPIEVTLKAPIVVWDLLGVGELLEAQGDLEAAVDRQAGQAQALLGQAQACALEGHCLAQDTQEQARRLLQRFQDLRERLQERRMALEAQSCLLQFFRDADEEMAWVQEKLPLAASQDCGQSLSAVRHLQEKHQNLESELSSHEALARVVVGTGRQLVQAGHSAACEVAARVQQLEEAMGSLRAEAARRRRQLQQAQEAQQLLAELLEAGTWLAERGSILDSEDMGQSAEATQALLRQLEVTRRDLEGFSPRLERLQQTAALLESRWNPESPKVLAQLQKVREACSELLRRAEGRGRGLQEQLQLHQLQREALLLDAWLTSRMATAESQDYGQDLEGVTVLEEKFDAFRKEAQSLGKAKVQALRELADTLERGAPGCYPQVQAQKSRIEATWERLDRAIKARAEKLAAVREARGLEQAMAELRGWVQGKMALMQADDSGHSLSSVQTLQRQHRHLEGELAALEKEMTRVRMEVCRLGRFHPEAPESLAEQLAGIQEAWAALEAKAQARGQRLAQAAQGHAFLGRCWELLAWVQETEALVSSEELCGDVAGAGQLLGRHEELGQEVKELCRQTQDVRQEGQQLVDSSHLLAPQVTGCLQELAEGLRQLQEAWALLRQRCKESWGLHKLRQRLEQAEAWLASREGLLLEPDCGHSVSDVELLLCRHEGLEKLLAAQEATFAQLQDTEMGASGLEEQRPLQQTQGLTPFQGQLLARGPGAQPVETSDLQPGVPIGPCTPFTTASLKRAARQQEPSGPRAAGDVKGVSNVEGSLGHKQQLPSGGSQASWSFWGSGSGPLWGSSLSLFSDSKAAAERVVSRDFTDLAGARCERPGGNHGREHGFSLSGQAQFYRLGKRKKTPNPVSVLVVRPRVTAQSPQPDLAASQLGALSGGCPAQLLCTGLDLEVNPKVMPNIRASEDTLKGSR
ncbi:Spectrin beta chain, brain 4 [Tupaia chinensis]|uniref:Spectrin beta chain, brain 4 n=1 Tax=Tupaia chinensis TaxID=246437 RepID=L9JC18_TUPCH|nr:Spectrin beta chain, brain 4 [Tupaia chinensis]